MIPPIDYLRNSHDEILAPNQWAAYLPLPEEVDLVKMKGYLKPRD